VQKWLWGLQEDQWAQCIALLFRLSQDGSELEFPESKPLGKGLFELRGHVERVQLRMIYCFVPGTRAVVICGFIKQQQKTPRAELELARKRREQVLADPERWIASLTHDQLIESYQQGRRRKA